jgi:hypothetical protein
VNRKELTAERLRELLHYDPDTGVFTRRVRTAHLAQVGAVAGSFDKHGYVCINLIGLSFKAHRLAWLYVYGTWPVEHLDHINGKTADNRISNLRDVCVSQNLMNSALSRANKTGFKGVWFDAKRNNWQAYITVYKNRIRLGRFNSADEAAAARVEAEARHFGEFSRKAG